MPHCRFMSSHSSMGVERMPSPQTGTQTFTFTGGQKQKQPPRPVPFLVGLVGPCFMGVAEQLFSVAHPSFPRIRLLCASDDLQFAGICLVASYWKLTVVRARLFFVRRAMGNCNRAWYWKDTSRPSCLRMDATSLNKPKTQRPATPRS